MPTRRGSEYTLAPPSGTRPMPRKRLQEERRFALASTMSPITSAKPAPTLAHGPLTADTIGQGRLRKLSQQRVIDPLQPGTGIMRCRCFALSACRHRHYPCAPTLAPAQKPRPAPVTIRARTPLAGLATFQPSANIQCLTALARSSRSAHPVSLNVMRRDRCFPYPASINQKFQIHVSHSPYRWPHCHFVPFRPRGNSVCVFR